MMEEATNSEVTISKKIEQIKCLTKENNFYYIQYSDEKEGRLYILNNHVFRLYVVDDGNFTEYPEPNDPEDHAKITIKRVEEYDFKYFKQSKLTETSSAYYIKTTEIEIKLNKTPPTMVVSNKKNKRKVLEQISPIDLNDKTSLKISQESDEQYFGGGMQNGRFTHKYNFIDIINDCNWETGGVPSPCPFYWSSRGYGILRNTWQEGLYDFLNNADTSHNEHRIDAFFFIGRFFKDIIADYYELTGHPSLLPYYAFYQAHLDCYNRDYWVKVSPDEEKALLFEDGHYYKRYQPNDLGDKKGIRQSLNGELNNYQFSARAMIDRYNKHDMPLGAFFPNDGYGAGYGQTGSFHGDIENLRQFVEYANKNNVIVGLWTESTLKPKNPEKPQKNERDLEVEATVAGVRALKTDVAWVYKGYSFALNAVETALNLFAKATDNRIRPTIFTVCGWAGTQRHAAVWSGDQYGGNWENVRFHIPTFIGCGLSGLPFVGSDVDGIFKGGDKHINIREYQWKIFTPLQLNMDGWGYLKTPFSFDNHTTDINRAYLKMKSILMPYNYSIAYEATQTLPMIRAMFLEFPNEKPAYTLDSQYQYMWGKYMLIVPIYNGEVYDNGNSKRNNVYLPDSNQIWVDMLTGVKYQGSRIYHNMEVPLWKLLVFIRDGAIIPITNAHNNPGEIQKDKRFLMLYPNGTSSFTLYEDDGISNDYKLKKEYAVTNIFVKAPISNKKGKVLVTIEKTVGTFNNFETNKMTLLEVMVSREVNKIGQILVKANKTKIKLKEVNSDTDFNNGENVFMFGEPHIVNPYFSKIADDKVKQSFLLMKIQKVNITTTSLQIEINNFTNKDQIIGSYRLNKSLPIPKALIADKVTRNSITIKWDPVDNITSYEIEAKDYIHSNLINGKHTFEDLTSKTTYSFRIRCISNGFFSDWSKKLEVKTVPGVFDNAVRGVIATCNYPSQHGEEINKLTDLSNSTMWHTRWGSEGQSTPDNPIILNFDLLGVYEIGEVQYHPRISGVNGIITRFEYMTSKDNMDWCRLETVDWKADNEVKTFIPPIPGFRYMRMTILKSVANFGSGRHMLFVKKA